MKKILYRKFLSDCLIFFIISLISTTVIIWVFQAVNYLDIVIDDGRDYSIYLSYAILSFPKIASKILPFAFFFSFSYVIAKYELKNELIIYWNFGINKLTFINFFFIFSLFLFFVQIILTAFMKLPLMFKGLSVAFISMLEAIAKSIDNIGYHLIHPFRTIRFKEVRDFISENAVTISLIITFIILIYITFNRRVN